MPDKDEYIQCILRNEFDFSDIYRKLHWVTCKVIMYAMLATERSLHFDNHQFVAYICIRFNQNLDENLM